MPAKIILAKKLNETPIRVTVANSKMTLEVNFDDFVVSMVQAALQDLAATIAKNAGSPALLLTQAQLAERLASTANVGEICDVIQRHSALLIGEVKKASVVAE